MAQEKVMAVWFFRGEQPDETWWEKIKPRYPNVCLYKVNILFTTDIEATYAFGIAEQGVKFFREAELLDECPFSFLGPDQVEVIQSIFAKHNGGKETDYKVPTQVETLHNLEEFKGAMSYAHGDAVVLCYYNDGQTMVEKFLDSRKIITSNVRFYKVHIRESPDISDELADDKFEKPCFRIYRNGIMVESIMRENGLANQIKKLKEEIAKYNGEPIIE